MPKTDNLVKNSTEEYLAEGVEHRIVISHMPFTHIDHDPFDIEQDVYSYWTKKLREDIDPELIICGHVHTLDIVMPGDSWDAYGQPCPVVIGSKPEENRFIGTGFVLGNGTVRVDFVDNLGWKESKLLKERENVFR